MQIIIAYDISDNDTRHKLAKELLRFGIRTQKSFFECEVTQKEYEEIKKIIKKITHKKDIVTLYTFHKSERRGNVQYLEIDDLIF